MSSPTPSLKEARSALEAQRTALIEGINAYVKSQQHLWAQVPELAFRANGRRGYSDNYGRAWRDKRWALQSSCGSRGIRGYTVFIDLEAGELLVATDDRIPAWPEDVVHLKITELDAEALVASLKEEAKQPFFDGRMEREYKQRMTDAGFA